MKAQATSQSFPWKWPSWEPSKKFLLGSPTPQPPARVSCRSCPALSCNQSDPQGVPCLMYMSRHDCKRVDMFRKVSCSYFAVCCVCYCSRSESSLRDPPMLPSTDTQPQLAEARSEGPGRLQELLWKWPHPRNDRMMSGLEPTPKNRWAVQVRSDMWAIKRKTR